MDGSKKWVVTTTGGGEAGDVAAALRGAGFQVEQELGEIGVITGRATDEVAEQARALPGVSDVSADQPIDIGPPGAPDTW